MGKYGLTVTEFLRNTPLSTSEIQISGNKKSPGNGGNRRKANPRTVPKSLWRFPVFRLRAPDKPGPSQGISPNGSGGNMPVYGGLVPLGLTHSGDPAHAAESFDIIPFPAGKCKEKKNCV